MAKVAKRKRIGRRAKKRSTKKGCKKLTFDTEPVHHNSPNNLKNSELGKGQEEGCAVLLCNTNVNEKVKSPFKNVATKRPSSSTESIGTESRTVETTDSSDKERVASWPVPLSYKRKLKMSTNTAPKKRPKIGICESNCGGMEEEEEEPEPEDCKEEEEEHNAEDDLLVAVQKAAKKKAKKIVLRSYTATDLNRAIVSIIHKGMSLRAASQKYGVPHQTLFRRVKSHSPLGDKRRGPPTNVPAEVEQEIVKFAVNVARIGYGLTHLELCTLTKDVLDYAGVQTTFKDNMPSLSWTQRFIRRHPILRWKHSEHHSKGRSEVTVDELVRQEFRKELMSDVANIRSSRASASEEFFRNKMEKKKASAAPKKPRRTHRRLEYHVTRSGNLENLDAQAGRSEDDWECNGCHFFFSEEQKKKKKFPWVSCDMCPAKFHIKCVEKVHSKQWKLVCNSKNFEDFEYCCEECCKKNGLKTCCK
ncbi:uncharacterized protein LOC135938050 [Cloeon dipterum]|uniref:uncharacterized protein LOC135938050 n=1 Tax=Cloeon dipterum TaxID=197152 RepID=UPI00321FF476